MGMYDKQQSSRFIRYQNITNLGTPIATAPFSAQTYQIRVMTQVVGWLNISNTTSTANDATIPTSAGGTGAYIGNTTNTGEYFSVSPGMVLNWASTSTSTTLFVSVSEMG